MPVTSSAAAASEPPSFTELADTHCAALVERIWAIAHLQPSAHVVIIGRRTLPLVLEFLRRGCCAVRSLRPDVPSPDHEAATLAWIVDVSDGDLDDALRAASSRAGHGGRVIVESAAILPSICERAVTQGLDVISFDHSASRLVLATPARPVRATLQAR